MSFVVLPPLYARDVDDANRLSLLRQATGQSSSSSSSAGSFSSRLDAILNVNAEPTRTQVGRQDARVRSLANQPVLDPLITSKADTRVATSERDFREKAAKEKKKKEQEGALDSRIDKSEKAYRDDREAFFRQQELVEEEQKEEAPQEDFQSYLDRMKEEQSAKEDLAPSLSNNPFYFTPFGKGNYDDNKSVIQSRLVQQGLSAEEARDIVNSVSSNEEIVMYLMREEDATYGDALEVIQI